MKEVLAGSKSLLPLNEVRHVNMPKYDEISVKDLWPQMQTHEEFMKYFPSRFPKGRLPDRTYFYNCMNTVMEGYVQEMISHANRVRATKSHEAEAAQTIEVTNEWFDKLKAIPFVSCKFICFTDCLQSARETLSTFSKLARNQFLRRESAARSIWSELQHSGWSMYLHRIARLHHGFSLHMCLK